MKTIDNIRWQHINDHHPPQRAAVGTLLLATASWALAAALVVLAALAMV